MKWAYLAALLCASYLIFATFNNLYQTENESNKVKNSLSRLLSLENVLVNIRSIESGQRGFMIFGDTSYLRSYYHGAVGIKRDTVNLKQLGTFDQSEQFAQKKLFAFINEKIKYSTSIIDGINNGEDSSTMRTNTRTGLKLMDSIAAYVKILEENDRAVLQSSNINSQRLAWQSTLQLSLLAIMFLLIFGITYYITNRDFKKILTSEQQLKFNASLIRNISDPIITTNKEDLITNWNSYAEKLYGFTEKEVYGKNIFDVLQVSEEQKLKENDGLSAGLEDHWKGESVHRHKNGDTLLVEVTVSSIKNEAADVIGYVSVIRDVTKRKEAEEQLKRLTYNLEEEVKVKSKELNSVFSRITDAFIAFDNNWNYTYLNKQAAELHGKPIAELLGKNVWEEFPEVMSEPFYDALVHAKKTMQPQRLQLYFSKIDKWYEDLIYPSEDGVSVYYHDVTERKKAELALEIAHEKLSYHLSNTPMAVVEFDTNAQIKKWNLRAEEIFGWTEQEIMSMGKVMNTLVYEEDVPLVETSIANLTHLQQRQGFLQLRNYTKDGKIIYCEWYNSVLRDSDGNINGILSLVQDISGRYLATKAIEESKIELQRSNDRFEKVATATNDAIWDWDLEKGIIWGNGAFCKLFEAEPESEFTMDDFINRIHPDDKEWVTETMQEVFRNKETYVSIEFRLTLANRLQYITVNDKAHVQYDEDGKPVRLLGALQDITQQKLYEQNILLEKELSDSIINSLPGIFYLYNKEGRLYRWNKNMELVTGYSADELKTLHPIDLIAPQDKALVQQKVEGVFREGDSYVEAQLETKHKQRIPFYFTGRLINYEGEPCLVGVGLDITDKVTSQDELEKSEERYRTLIEQASDGIFISDFAGNYIDVNSNGLRLSGYTKEELMNLTIYDLMAPGDEVTNPVRLDELMLGNVVINERKMQRKDGKLLDVEISAKLLADGRFLGIVRDISARKKAEEELKSSEEKYRLLFHKNPMPMWMLSLPERHFLDVNDAAVKFYGYSREEFLQMDIWDIRPKDAKRQLKQQLAKLKEGESYNGIWQHLKKDGRSIRVNIISHDIIYDGRPAKLVLASDITAKLEAEERLQESHEAYKQLASHLETIREAERTHIAREIHDELGQQLTGLKMDISWLSRRIKEKDGEVQQKIKETISLIDGTVKTVRRIATELRPSILDDLGLVPAMEWQSEEFERRSGIPTEFTSNMSAVNLDPDLATGIFRIYQESLTNIMRHADASHVEASLQIGDEKINLTITDDGKGFLVEEISNKKTLGLMGMRERATLLGGSYHINSKPSGGTSVNIIVPFKN